MDFFERQRAARGTSVRLVVLFVIAVVLIVALVDFIVLGVPYLMARGESRRIDGDTIQGLVTATVITIAIIGFGTLSKIIALRAGGSAVARSVGATPVDPTTSDPRLRQYVNVVEEMSIASGVPIPQLFVLEREPGINAFAAGFNPRDAAICVTGGALEQLNRDELQGVIGHEFSHVLNGDMRLNIKLMGLLYGILLLAIFGLRLLPFSGQSFNSRQRKSVGFLFVAVALIVVGFVGQFFARLIQAGVSRQRERLADASAVQFTRQTDGLVGALRKIGGLQAAGGPGSAMADKASEGQLGHMLFGEGRSRVTALLATHPPLEERIAALSGVSEDRVRAELAAVQPVSTAPSGAAGFAAAPAGPAGPVGPVGPVGPPAAVASRVGTITADDLARGARINDRIPPPLRTLAGQPSTVVPLVLALLLDERPDIRHAQLGLVAARLGTAVATAVDGIGRQTLGLDPALALPLAQLSVPQLVARPAGERTAVDRAIGELVRADGRVTAFEYCLSRLLGTQLVGGPSPRRRASSAEIDGAQLTLLAVVAASGNADPAAAEHAYATATAIALPGARAAFRPPPQPWDALDANWPLLLGLPPGARRRLVEAVTAAVSADGLLTVAEAELLRVTCNLLGAPLPPLLG